MTDGLGAALTAAVSLDVVPVFGKGKGVDGMGVTCVVLLNSHTKLHTKIAVTSPIMSRVLPRLEWFEAEVFE
jgi:hypothetical protein